MSLLFCANSFAKILDQAIVIIENDVITQSEYQKKLNFIINQYRISGNPLPADQSDFRKQVLESMINTRLQLNYAKNSGMNVQEWMIDKAMEDMANKSGVSLSEFREKIISQGVDYNVYRNLLKEDLIIREVKRRIVSQKVKVSKKEIQEFIKHQGHIFKENNQYKISMILIAISEEPSVEEKSSAKDKIKMIKRKFLNGEKFTSLAKNYSDSGNALSGGDLGWRKITEVPQMFLDQLENMGIGEISNLIENNNGYYIFYLEDKKEMEKIKIEERKVRHILIKRNAIVTDDRAKSSLIELKKRIESGESFSDIARAYSEDTISASLGGELEWAAPGTFVPEFEDVIDTLPINKISDPFSSQFGWHILEVLGKRNQDNTEAIKMNLAKRYITSSRAQEVVDAWIIELKGKNYIKYVSETAPEAYINSKKGVNKIDDKSWDPFL
ncbi:MAG: peptidylprolyl isomerase [Gammaproteobacteria bacterium]|jgi:peptidyl-prolyl cis-trans isomerase SurA|tara:strand:- start:1193 stop:2518 length:1326 start_codon:yes stop_codon:yes gene_type:complete